MKNWKELAAILLMWLLLYLLTFDSKLDLNGDNVEYYLLGRAISQGEGYTAIWSPDSLPFTTRPIGYPLMIASLMALGMRSILGFKILSGLFLFATLTLLFLTFRRITRDKTLALVATTLVGLNIHLLHYSFLIMSEIPFLFFLALTWHLLIKREESLNPKRSRQYSAAVILSLAMCFYVRSMGIVCLLGVLVYLLARREWKQAAGTVGTFGLLALPHLVRNRVVGSGSAYLQSLVHKDPYRPDLGTMGFLDYAERIYQNAIRYVSVEVPHSFFGSIDNKTASPLGWIVGFVLLGFVIWGLLRLRTHRALVLGLLVAVFGVLLLWPRQWYGTRFLLPFLPILLLLLVNGVHQLLLRLSVPPQWLYLLAGVYLEANLTAYAECWGRAREDYPAAYRNYFTLAAWARDNTEPEDVFVARKPQFFYFFSDRRAFTFEFTRDDQEFLRDLEKKKAKYVVFAPLGYASTLQYLLPTIERNPDRFRIVCRLENPSVYLLELKPGG